jgi:hypothetical protein
MDSFEFVCFFKIPDKQQEKDMKILAQKNILEIFDETDFGTR